MEFVLNDLERKSELWHKLKHHYEDRLKELRAKNDKWLGGKETAHLRGQINQVKEFLDLEREVSPMERPPGGVQL